MKEPFYSDPDHGVYFTQFDTLEEALKDMGEAERRANARLLPAQRAMKKVILAIIVVLALFGLAIVARGQDTTWSKEQKAIWLRQSDRMSYCMGKYPNGEGAEAEYCIEYAYKSLRSDLDAYVYTVEHSDMSPREKADAYKWVEMVRAYGGPFEANKGFQNE
jgi:hypothetical protein